jgi:hypothetical protein
MRKTLLWILAVVLTLGSAYYQRRTGPTHPLRGTVEIGGSEISYRLIRSFPMPLDAPIRVDVEDASINGYYRIKRTPSHDAWQELPLQRREGQLVATIPQQPPAGKIKYHIFLQKGEDTVALTEEPVTIRFRGSVPAWAMIPHILAMFLAMLLSTRAGLAALFNEKTQALSLWTVVTLLLGGLIFGPVIQKFAFGAWWTGWPFGTDLTDNKTAVAFLFWIIALARVRKNPYHRTWVIVAALVMLVVFMIPHSLLGSEIDWTEEGAGAAVDTAQQMVACLWPRGFGIF